MENTLIKIAKALVKSYGAKEAKKIFKELTEIILSLMENDKIENP